MSKMEVKCPKCRYRFQIEQPSGVFSLSCVCVRCGTPFTHIVETADSLANGNGSLANGGGTVGGQLPKSPLEDTSATGEGREGQLNDSPNARRVPSAFGSQGNMEWSNPYPNRRSSHASIFPKRIGKSFLLRMLLIVAMVAALLFVLRWCSRDDAYDYADVETHRMSSTERIDTVRPLPTMASRDRAVATPQWVFGTWRVRTQFGVVEIRLADVWIRETIDGETTHGKFFYTHGQINCIFNKCDTFVYRVDDKRQLIDAGDGVWMTKVSNR